MTALSLNRSAALMVMFGESDVFAHLEGVAASLEWWMRSACLYLAVHCGVLVAANWNSSARIPPRFGTSWVVGPELSGLLWVLYILVLVILYFVGLVHWQGQWPMWTVPFGLSMPVLLYWLITAAEPVQGSRGRERARVTPDRLRRRRFAPLIGLMWEGARSVPFAMAFLAFLLPFVADSAIRLVVGAFRFETHFRLSGIPLQALTTTILIFAAMAFHYRWRSWGEKGEFLITAGVEVGKARRIELLTGAFLGLEMLVIGFIVDPQSVQDPRFWAIYALPVCTVLLLCNHSPSPLLRSKGLRARELFPWMAIGCLFHVAGLVIVNNITAQQRYGPIFGAALVTPFVIYGAGCIALWIWAFVQAGDEENLRRAELDPTVH
jgi:hypothetical protein